MLLSSCCKEQLTFLEAELKEMPLKHGLTKDLSKLVTLHYILILLYVLICLLSDNMSFSASSQWKLLLIKTVFLSLFLKWIKSSVQELVSG